MAKGRKSVQGAEQGTLIKKNGSGPKNNGKPPVNIDVQPTEQLKLPEGLLEQPTQDKPEDEVQKLVGSEPKKSNSVDDMSGDELKAYAAEVGVSQRDIDGLTEDRLRQNCKARIFTAMEDD